MAIFSAKELLQRHGISYVESRKGKYTTGCPHCADNYLSVEIKQDGVVWFCQSCQQGNGEKFEQGGNGSGLGPIKASYDYLDESGKLLFQVLRFEPVNGAKQFRQRTSPEQERWSIKGVRIVPFHLPELLEAIGQGQVVFVVEGEKDVLTLQRLGIVATCNPMGAMKWRREFGELLRGADVVIVVDNDEPGHEHGRLVAENLIGVAKRVRLLDLAPFWPGIGPSDDISDWVEAGLGALQLWAMIEELPTLERGQPTNGRDQSPAGAGDGQASPPVLPRGGFMRDFTPCDYLVDGILQRRFVYALTGQTGHAKSAIALLLAELVASAEPNAMFGRHRVEKGQVCYFVGENPDDIRMRLIGMASLRTDDATKDRMFFVPGVFNIEAVFDRLYAEMAHYGNFDLIIVDTSAAYFFGDEELSNTQMGAHARKLRRLTTLPGEPGVLVLCHPIKHVIEPAQLLPRGGGAFLNEVDGNLTAWKHDDCLIELHHNKIRGPGFEPIALRLETIRTPKLTDAKGRMLPTVRAAVITDTDEDLVKDKTRDDEDRAMAIRLKHGEADMLSYAKIAEELEWFTGDGSPAKMRVMRAYERLERAKLMRHERGQWLLTEKGKEQARKAAMRIRAIDELKKSRPPSDQQH
jgi:hypothetical protein